jgi:homoserine O-acetyltransferase
VDRFDANTYLYFSKAMDYFDLPRQYGDLTKAMERAQSRFLAISFTSDWLFPARQSRELVNALLAAGKDVSYGNIECPYGHDSFLLESEVQGRLLRGFLAETHARLRGKQSEKVKSTIEEITKNQHVSAQTTGSIFSGERVDHRKIAQLIEPDSTVLDLGCGDGQLLLLLQAQKKIRGLGMTLGEKDVQRCVERGVSVVQYDLEKDLGVFGDNSFDYVVLSQTLQAIRRPAEVLREMLRIGRQVIVSFPNFAYWRGRMQMMFKGRTPVFESLPYKWYDKPSESSINYMSISDFEEFVRRELGARLVKRIPLSSRNGREVNFLPNLRADEAIFVIAR